MCIGNIDSISPPIFPITKQKLRPKRSRVRVHKLRRKRSCEERVEKDMELKNLKLYMKNMSILEENEKLRKKASLLHQENLALMSELQKKLNSPSSINHVATTLSY